MIVIEQLDSTQDSAGEQPRARLKIAIRIFDDRERWHLSQIMSLAAPRCRVDMESVAAADADVVFINPEEPGAELFIRNAGRGKRPLPVVYGGDAAPGIPWLVKPARSPEMVTLLNQLPDQLELITPDTPAAPTMQDSPDLLPTHDFVSVLSLLRSIRSHATPVQLDTGNGKLVIDPRSGTVYIPAQCAGPNLAGTYTALETLPAERINNIDRVTMVKDLAARRVESLSLDELGWSLSFLARPAEPAPAAALETRVRLKHWPNFARLEHSQIHLVWAGMLIRQPLTLSALLARSPQGFAPAARFYNACALSGLLICSDQARKTKVVTRGEQRTGIFKKILQKLAS